MSLRDRAVRLVEEQQKAGLSQWAAIESISQKLGCTPETLRRWVRRVERDEGKRPGLTRAVHRNSDAFLTRCPSPRPGLLGINGLNGRYPTP